MYYIFKIILIPTQKIYIKKIKSNKEPILCKTIINYGTKRWLNDIQNFTINDMQLEILAKCSLKDEAEEIVKNLIDVFNSDDPSIGYNQSFKGENNPNYGRVCSQETKEKISKANKGRKFSDEVNKKKGRPGIEFSDDHKRKISESLKGHIVSDETRNKISENKKGKQLSLEHRNKISESITGEKNPMYGKHHTNEAKLKLSKSLTGRKLTEEQRKKWSEAQKGKVFSEEHKKNISNSLKGKKHRPLTDEEKLTLSIKMKKLREVKPVWNAGKITPDEIKEKISASLKGRPSPNKGRPRSNETTLKINETKRLKGTFNSSSEEDKVFDLLKSIYGDENIIRGFSTDSRYPFQCDFYIIPEDKFIECNFHWTHGGKPYIHDSEDCKRKLEYWKSKGVESQYYRNAIYCWTDLDLRKLKIAKDNNLNYEVYYSLLELMSVYKKGQEKI